MLTSSSCQNLVESILYRFGYSRPLGTLWIEYLYVVSLPKYLYKRGIYQDSSRELFGTKLTDRG